MASCATSRVRSGAQDRACPIEYLCVYITWGTIMENEQMDGELRCQSRQVGGLPCLSPSGLYFTKRTSLGKEQMDSELRYQSRQVGDRGSSVPCLLYPSSFGEGT